MFGCCRSPGPPLPAAAAHHVPERRNLFCLLMTATVGVTAAVGEKRVGAWLCPNPALRLFWLVRAGFELPKRSRIHACVLPPRPGRETASDRSPSGRRTVCGMIAWVSGIYDEPELYQLACAYRDVPAEVTALLAWCARHCALPGGRAAGSVLELAAGPAEHSRELAGRGLRATALDRSPAM